MLFHLAPTQAPLSVPKTALASVSSLQLTPLLQPLALPLPAFTSVLPPHAPPAPPGPGFYTRTAMLILKSHISEGAPVLTCDPGGIASPAGGCGAHMALTLR